MEGPIVISRLTSLRKDVLPLVQVSLSENGYALVSFEDTSENLSNDMIAFSAWFGSICTTDISYHLLSGIGSAETLAAHNEGIAYTAGIIPYFGLGCLTPSAEGGETRIFDARLAASILRDEIPLLQDVVMEYTSLANPEERIQYPLIVDADIYGKVLRYRSNVVTNRIVVSKGFTDTEIYNYVDSILERSVVRAQSWKRGELILVDNLLTLHDRLPYQGERKMLRVRFGDSLNKRICY